MARSHSRAGISSRHTAGPTTPYRWRRGWHLMVASMTRARVAITQREFEQAECDAHEAVACAAVTGAPLFTPDVLECLAYLAGEDGSHREAARLFGAAEALRAVWARCGSRSMTPATKPQWRHSATPSARRTLNARRPRARPCPPRRRSPTRSAARGERKRPASGWASLTPAERDVVRLVCERLATRTRHTAFRLTAHHPISPDPRIHRTGPYTSLLQLAREAARHA